MVVYEDKIDFLLCEVKAGRCDLNPSWLDPARKNVEYAVRWMGFERDDAEIQKIAGAVYREGVYECTDHALRFVMIGNDENHTLGQSFPKVTDHAYPARKVSPKAIHNGSEGINRQNWEQDIADFAKRCSLETPDQLLRWAAAEDRRH